MQKECLSIALKFFVDKRVSHLLIPKGILYNTSNTQLLNRIVHQNGLE